jgi:hypothetical protein
VGVWVFALPRYFCLSVFSLCSDCLPQSPFCLPTACVCTIPGGLWGLCPWLLGFFLSSSPSNFPVSLTSPTS